MTNDQFAAWRRRHFRSVAACARALGLDQESVAALEKGQTRKGNPYPVPRHIELAAAAVTLQIAEYDGGPVVLGGG